MQLSGATSVGDLGPPASPSPSPSPSPPDLGAPGYGSIVLADHPIAWYRLDDVSVAHDSSAANVSAAYGGQVERAQPGLVRGDDAVALFPGAANSTNDEIVTRSGSATIQPASISIELWLSQTSVNPDETALVVYDSTAPVPPWVVYIAGDRIQFQVRTAANVNGVNLASATTLVNDTTYHVVATFDGTTMSLYVNGALDASTSLAGAIAYDNVNYTLAIGGAIAGSNTPAFSGKLGEVALYDTALSAARVAAHAQAGRLTP